MPRDFDKTFAFSLASVMALSRASACTLSASSTTKSSPLIFEAPRSPTFVRTFPASSVLRTLTVIDWLTSYPVIIFWIRIIARGLYVFFLHSHSLKSFYDGVHFLACLALGVLDSLAFFRHRKR